MIAGDTVLSADTSLAIDINGTSYDQLVVTGTNRLVALNDAELDLTVQTIPLVGSKLTILSLVDTSSSIVGQFAGLPQNGLLQVDSAIFTIDYAGGDGNDVVLTAQATAELDLGDAPDSFGTTLANDGARHFATGPILGNNRDADSDGYASQSADGDSANDVADEDGVAIGQTQSSLLTVVSETSATFTITVSNANGKPAFLDAWVDWNDNGVFEASERIADHFVVVDDRIN